MADLRSRKTRMIAVDTEGASPFAQSLLFRWIAASMYEGDAPLAERRAAALALDRDLLRELLGTEELRDLLDPAPSTTPSSNSSGSPTGAGARGGGRRARPAADAGRPHRGRGRGQDRRRAAAGSGSLVADGRAIRVKVAGEDRFAAVEDAARLRDALGVSLPRGLPGVFTEATDQPLETLVARYARTHGPFTAVDVGARLGASAERVRTAWKPSRPMAASWRASSGRRDRAGSGWTRTCCGGSVSVPSRPCARRSNRSRPPRWGGSSRPGRAPTGPAARATRWWRRSRGCRARRSPPRSWRPTSCPHASAATAPPTSTPCAPAATSCGSAPSPWEPTTAASCCVSVNSSGRSRPGSPAEPPDGRTARGHPQPSRRTRSLVLAGSRRGVRHRRRTHPPARALGPGVGGRGDERHPGAGAGLRPRRLGEGARGQAGFTSTARSVAAAGTARRRRTVVAGRRPGRTRAHAHRSRACPRAPAARPPRRADAGVGLGGEHPGRVRRGLPRPQGDGGSRQGPPWVLRGRARRGAVRAPRRGGPAPLDA